MAPVSSALQPPKARLQALLSGVEALEARVLQTRPIQVLTVARCGHDDCGAPMPADLPENALILELGCEHQIPDAPPLEEIQHQSRADRRRPEDTAGQGIGPERKKRLLKTIRLL